jgi:1,4-alpha-glucan branching enzyme
MTPIKTRGALLLALACGLSSCSIAPHPNHDFRPQQTDQGVLFELHAPAATRVQVVGNWEGNAWGGLVEKGAWLDPNRGSMHPPEGDGNWTLVIPLEPGRYLYQFVIDGHLWISDPGNPERAQWRGAESSFLLVRSHTAGTDARP